MTETAIMLSIEELAYAMGVMGGTDTATGFLLGLLGPRPPLEVEGRLLAAAHSLVARGYLDFDVATSASWLTGELANIVELMIHSDYSLRLNRVTEKDEEVATLYVSDKGLVLHQILKGVVSHVEPIPDLETAQERCLTFFDLSDVNGDSPSDAVKIPASMLDTIRQSLREQNTNALIDELVIHRLDRNRAFQFVEDLRNESMRGSIVRLEIQRDQVVSQRGMLIVKGLQRSWLFEMLPDETDAMNLFLGSSGIFRNIFLNLII
jgi:hypothetical protein